jgi:hypothetical protein
MEQEVMAAERAVSEAREKLVAELEAASENGKQAIERVVERARPMALAAAAVAGVAVLAGTVVMVRSSFSRSRARYWAPPRQRSVFAQAARQALTSAAGTIAAALARRALVSLELAGTEAPPTEARSNGHSRAKRARPEDSKQTAQ